MVPESVQLAKSVRVDHYDVKLSSSSGKRVSFNVPDTVELAESERVGVVRKRRQHWMMSLRGYTMHQAEMESVSQGVRKYQSYRFIHRLRNPNQLQIRPVGRFRIPL